MNFSITLLLTIYLINTVFTINSRLLSDKWSSFKFLFNKQYSTKEEELERFRIFSQNLEFVKNHNQRFENGTETFEVEINQYGDLTQQEFLSFFTGLNTDTLFLEELNATVFNKNLLQAPLTVDWVSRGYVTPVKNQGACGSCWAFSAIGSCEGQLFKKTGKLVRLSEQNLIDCSTSYGNMACDGGYLTEALRYISDFGIEAEDAYPYVGRIQRCKYNKQLVYFNISGYGIIPEKDEEALEQAVAFVGPISVAVDASRTSFQFYKKGIYYDSKCSSDYLNHAMLAVGYTQDYWLVKNSWGVQWGDNGYVKIAKNKNNNCGIATAAVYPIV